MQTEDLKGTETFLKSINEFTPTAAETAKIVYVALGIAIISIVLFKTLALGGAFLTMDKSSLMEAQAIICLLMPYGASVAKTAKTKEEWGQGILILLFPVIFATSLAAALA